MVDWRPQFCDQYKCLSRYSGNFVHGQLILLRRFPLSSFHYGVDGKLPEIVGFRLASIKDKMMIPEEPSLFKYTVDLLSQKNDKEFVFALSDEPVVKNVYREDIVGCVTCPIAFPGGNFGFRDFNDLPFNHMM